LPYRHERAHRALDKFLLALLAVCLFVLLLMHLGLADWLANP
jgi:hypothetical protein